MTNVDDYSGSARLLAATTLRNPIVWKILSKKGYNLNIPLFRNVLGTKNLGDILSERESIAHELHELLYEATEPWGVQVERVEVNSRSPLDLELSRP